MGRQRGLTEAQLRALGDFQSNSELSDLEKLVVGYAAAMTETPVEVPDGVVESLRRNFTEKQIVELTSAIAWEQYRARFDHALGIEAEGFSEGAYCPLPPRAKPPVARPVAKL